MDIRQAKYAATTTSKEDALYSHYVKEKRPKRHYRKRKLKNHKRTFTRTFNNSEEMVNFAKLNIFNRDCIQDLELAEMILCSLAFNCVQENCFESWFLIIESLQIYQFNSPIFVILQELGTNLLIDVLKINRKWKVKNKFVTDDAMFCSDLCIDIEMLKTFKINVKKRPNLLKYNIFQ